MTEDEFEAVGEAADDLGERVVEALAERTGRDPSAFDIDPGEYDFPEPDD